MNQMLIVVMNTIAHGQLQSCKIFRYARGTLLTLSIESCRHSICPQYHIWTSPQRDKFSKCPWYCKMNIQPDSIPYSLMLKTKPVFYSFNYLHFKLLVLHTSVNMLCSEMSLTVLAQELLSLPQQLVLVDQI